MPLPQASCSPEREPGRRPIFQPGRPEANTRRAARRAWTGEILTSRLRARGKPGNRKEGDEEKEPGEGPRGGGQRRREPAGWGEISQHRQDFVSTPSPLPFENTHIHTSWHPKSQLLRTTTSSRAPSVSISVPPTRVSLTGSRECQARDPKYQASIAIVLTPRVYPFVQ